VEKACDMIGYGFIQYWIINYPQYKKIEKPSTVVCGIKSKHEEPFQGTEGASSSAISQGVV
jgi:hypothetical protein